MVMDIDPNKSDYLFLIWGIFLLFINTYNTLSEVNSGNFSGMVLILIFYFGFMPFIVWFFVHESNERIFGGK